jgi:ferredoxin, 2Fe-2S
MSTFKITFQPLNVEVKVNSDPPTPTRDGLPGSLLAIALAHDIDIDHACGGVNACSTCHVVVQQGFDSLAPASEVEEDMLDNAPGLTLQSRLACQAVPDGSSDLVIEIPHWNRNLVSEDHPQDDA